MPVRGAELTGGSLLSDVITDNPLLALSPLRVEEVETTINGKLGKTEATWSQVLEILPEGGYVDHGEHPVFWSFIRLQMDEQCDEEYRWLVGRIKKGNRAYRLQPPTPEEIEMAEVSADIYEATMALEAEATEQYDGEPEV